MGSSSFDPQAYPLSQQALIHALAQLKSREIVLIHHFGKAILLLQNFREGLATRHAQIAYGKVVHTSHLKLAALDVCRVPQSRLYQ
jgi:hypothetical protein